MRDNENNSIAVLAALLLMAVFGLAGLVGFVFFLRNQALRNQALIAEQQARVAQERALIAKEQSDSAARATRDATLQEKLLNSVEQEAHRSAIDHRELEVRTLQDLEQQIADLSSKLEATEAALREERFQRDAAEAAKMEALKAAQQAIEARAASQ